MISCKNCAHEVRKNYYGGWLHTPQWMNYCSTQVGTKECGCTIPIGKV